MAKFEIKEKKVTKYSVSNDSNYIEVEFDPRFPDEIDEINSDLSIDFNRYMFNDLINLSEEEWTSFVDLMSTIRNSNIE